MKASSATSGAAPTAPPATSATPTGARPSASSPTRIADAPAGGFPLAGPSAFLDPLIHAYRQDLADAALAGRVIASHYADPLSCRLARPAALLVAPGGEALIDLATGDEVRILDNSRGWAWGYAAGKVGYVPADALCA